MKRLFILTFALVASMVIAGCTKETDVPTGDENNNFVDEFVGEYDLNITYKTQVDGVEQDGTSVLNGTFSISAQNDHHFAEVVGVVNLSGQEIEFYHTTGSLNANGDLVLENSTLTIQASGLVCTMNYNDIHLQDPLEFYSELHTIISGRPVVYKMNNTCHKL